MTFSEFWDWLQFDSPDKDVHAQALAILRYTTPTAQEEYVKRLYNRVESIYPARTGRTREGGK